LLLFLKKKKGLEELYDFQIAHPTIDLNKYFKRCSDVFQKYIAEGLERVRRERAKKENLENHGYHASSVTPSLNLFSSNTPSGIVLLYQKFKAFSPFFC
jgi:hypothetical protein